jgi:single-strand DNA-binding protein
MNSINLIGNICNDIELKKTNSGKSVVSINLAVKRPYSKDTTDFIPLVIWNQSAEYLGQYAHKGSKIAVSGKLTSRKYEDRDGNNRTAYEVVCDSVEICESKKESEQSAPAPTTYIPTAYTDAAPRFEEIEDSEELPF